MTFKDFVPPNMAGAGRKKKPPGRYDDAGQPAPKKKTPPAQNPLPEKKRPSGFVDFVPPNMAGAGRKKKPPGRHDDDAGQPAAKEKVKKAAAMKNPNQQKNKTVVNKKAAPVKKKAAKNKAPAKKTLPKKAAPLCFLQKDKAVAKKDLGAPPGSLAAKKPLAHEPRSLLAKKPPAAAANVVAKGKEAQLASAGAGKTPKTIVGQRCLDKMPKLDGGPRPASKMLRGRAGKDVSKPHVSRRCQLFNLGEVPLALIRRDTVYTVLNRDPNWARITSVSTPLSAKGEEDVDSAIAHAWDQLCQKYGTGVARDEDDAMERLSAYALACVADSHGAVDADAADDVRALHQAVFARCMLTFLLEVTKARGRCTDVVPTSLLGKLRRVFAKPNGSCWWMTATTALGAPSLTVRVLYLSAPFLCNGGKSRLCVLDRHCAGTA